MNAQPDSLARYGRRHHPFRHHGEQLTATNILHDQVDVFVVIVRFIVLADVWVVQSMQNGHLLFDLVDL